MERARLPPLPPFPLPFPAPTRPPASPRHRRPRDWAPPDKLAGGPGGSGRRLEGLTAARGRSQNLIFRFLQSRTRIWVWLYDITDIKIEGVIVGFDEYMNLVLDDAHEVSVKKNTKRAVGRILLKGDNVTLMQSAGASS